MENQSWFLAHNAPAHRSDLVKDNVTTLQHPLYPSDLAEAGFFHLFPLLKLALTVRRVCYATEITKNATKELKRLSQNGFQKCFQQVYSPRKIFTVPQGDCFKAMWLK
jgi:hypothetical protein